jgi:hypothetical protein
VYLSPYIRGGRTKRQAAEVIETADFLASEVDGGDAHPRFHIELKAGPSSIEEMSEFQLDVNDYNDIVGPAINTGLPVYVFHVQLGVEYLLPTKRAVALDFWWTDVLRLRDSVLRLATRRDETKAAVYFCPSAFQSGHTFPEEVANRKYEELGRNLSSSPPDLI